jgi:hypothetical protein
MSKYFDLFSDLTRHEHRYDCVRLAIEQHLPSATGFLIVGELDEQNHLQQWQEKVNLLVLHFSNLINLFIARSNRFSTHLIIQYSSDKSTSKFPYYSSKKKNSFL